MSTVWTIIGLCVLGMVVLVLFGWLICVLGKLADKNRRDAYEEYLRGPLVDGR